MNTTTAGGLLRESRLRQHLSISECAKSTHISARFLDALESENWDALPSESHRLGFLKLYARFLEIPSEEIVLLYHKSRSLATVDEEFTRKPAKPSPGSSVPLEGRIIPWQQMVLILILGLLVVWAIYHGVTRQHIELDIRPDVWARFHPHHSRLPVNKSPVVVQRIRIKAEADDWLRVTDNHQLLYEGILPAGNVKEWTGLGPFFIKIGNIDALAVYWNDQPVDLKSGVHGHLNDLLLPPSMPSHS